VKTEVVNGVYQYSIDESVIVADGKSHTVNFQGGQYPMTAACKDASLNVDITLDGGSGDNPDCGNEAWNLVYSLNFTPMTAAGDKIAEKHAGKTVCAGGKQVAPEDMAGSMTCVKK
jgi:hypothetical protein